MAGVKGMKWGFKKQKTPKPRKQNIRKQLMAAGFSPKLYNVWSMMNDRCHNSSNADYDNYGGRGVSVCDRWRRRTRGDFEGLWNFVRDVGNPPERGSLDRYPNNNGGYEPGNIRWASRREQANNRRRSSRSIFFKNRPSLLPIRAKLGL